MHESTREQVINVIFYNAFSVSLYVETWSERLEN
jgi:hypothetical protein